MSAKLPPVNGYRTIAAAILAALVSLLQLLGVSVAPDAVELVVQLVAILAAIYFRYRAGSVFVRGKPVPAVPAVPTPPNT